MQCGAIYTIKLERILNQACHWRMFALSDRVLDTLQHDSLLTKHRCENESDDTLALEASHRACAQHH